MYTMPSLMTVAALSFLSATVSVAHADTGVLSRADAVIDSLAFSVSDLRPDDSVQAGVTLLRGATSFVAADLFADRENYEYAGRYNAQATAFNPLAVGVKTPDQQAVATLGDVGLKSHVQLGAYAFDGPVKPGSFTSATYPGNHGPARSALVESEERFSLAAGSEITLSGTMHLSTSLNLETLAGMSWLNQIGGNQSLLAKATASSQVELMLWSPADQVEIDAQGPRGALQASYCCIKPIGVSLTTQQYLGAWGVDEPSGGPAQIDQDFQYVIRNHGNAAVEFSVFVKTFSAYGASVTAVPEASSWAMALAGCLALMPLFARRRRA